MGKALRAAAAVLAVCVLFAVILTVVLDRGPWTRWVAPTILIAVAYGAATWFRERRRTRTA